MSDKMKDSVEDTDYIVVPALNNQMPISPEFVRSVSELPGMRRLYVHDGMDSYSMHTYANDPSAFLPEGAIAITVGEAKEKFSDVLLAFRDRMVTPTDPMPPLEYFLSAEPSEQAQRLVNFRLNNDEFPDEALDTAVRKHVVLAVAQGRGVFPTNRAMALMGYYGHYLGDDNAEQFIRTMDFSDEGADIDSSCYGKIQQKLVSAKEVFKNIDGALSEISEMLVNETPGILSSLQGLGAAIYEMGLDSKPTHHLAHRSTLSQNLPTPDMVQDMSNRQKR